MSIICVATRRVLAELEADPVKLWPIALAMPVATDSLGAQPNPVKVYIFTQENGEITDRDSERRHEEGGHHPSARRQH